MTSLQQSNHQSLKDVTENRSIAAIGYISVLCIVPLVVKRNSAFTQFHAKQGLVLFIAEVITWLTAPIFIATILLAWVPAVLTIIFIVASLYGIYSAWNGRKDKLPGVDWVINKLNF